MYKLLIIIFLLPISLVSQEKTNTLLLNINHTLQIPGGDIAKRFGINSDLSLSCMYISNNHLTITMEGGILFGSNIKETDLFNNMDGIHNELISPNGEIPTIRLFERGARFDLSIGKYLKFKDRTHNTGLLISIGLGYIYHKILIETITIELPQLTGDLLHGYDRLCGGLLTKQFIGYMYFSKKNNIRFLTGIEAIQGFTQDLRGYNYTDQTFVSDKRIDHLIGLKIGFIVPIYKQKTGKFYYY